MLSAKTPVTSALQNFASPIPCLAPVRESMRDSLDEIAAGTRPFALDVGDFPPPS